MYQFTHITRDKGSLVHDDRIDALAIACQYVKDMVLVDTEKTVQLNKEREMQRWLDEKIYGSSRLSKGHTLGNFISR